MKTIFAFWVSVALAGSYSLAEEVPPAFEKAGNGPAAAAKDEIDPFDPVETAPKLIRVQVEHIEMSHKDLTRLMMEDNAETSDAKALRMKVQELMDKDTAKVIDTQILVGRSGENSTTGSRQEFIYPTEYEPPGFGVDLEKKLEEIGAFPIGLGNPVAFETRNLGSSMECEPILGEDNKTIGLRLESELTWHTGNTVWGESKDTMGNVYKVAMPDFYVMDTNTNVTCIAGQYLMVAALSPKNAEGKLAPDRKVMVFVKCDVLPVVP
jgi:hypothetical protein